MNARKLGAAITFLGISGMAWFAVAAEKGQVKPANAEMKIFQVWVGEWNEVASFSNGLKVKAKGSNRFILGGHYLQSKFTIDLGKGRTLSHIMMFGWDAQKKKYRGWMFSSSGRSLASTGVWDAKKKELVTTSVADAKGMITKTTTRIVSRNELRWDVVQIDKKGKVIPLVNGVDTRRKK